MKSQFHRNLITPALLVTGLVLPLLFPIRAAADGPNVWTPHESNRYWLSIACSDDGAKLIAANSGGQLYTSTNSGVDWTARDTNRNWFSVASSASGAKLIAGVLGGQLYTSTDFGVTWTPRETTRQWGCVASSADGTKLVAGVGGNSVGKIYTSTNSGVDWNLQPTTTSRQWYSITSSDDGTKLAAVAVDFAPIYTSTNSGVSWTATENARSWYSIASSSDGTKLVAVCQGLIYTSTDSGVSWTPRASSRDWISVASSADGTKLVAAVYLGKIYTSTDSGENWTPQESDRAWFSVASSADGTKLVAGVQLGKIYTTEIIDAPVLEIAPATPGQVTVSWTPDAPGWLLQENPDVASTNWMHSASGTNNPAMISATGTAKFYRLLNTGMPATLNPLNVNSKVPVPLPLLDPTSFNPARLNINTLWRQARDNAVARAINPGDYECASTPFDEWVVARILEIGIGDALTLINEGVLDWPTFYALLLDNDDADDFIGVNGEHTKELLKRHKDNQRFWDVPTEDIQLHGMHGEVIANDALMVPAVQLYFLLQRQVQLTEAQARQKVDLIQRVIERNPKLGYDHPLFTLNAVAFSAQGQDLLGNGVIVPDKIVMGDGLLEALQDLGFESNAPDYVHAHEFGHHVQYELGVFDDYDGSPEATRRTELMADGFGAYYCAHARGATFQAKRFAEVLSAAYSIGDCAFDNLGHHGTPNQREAAAAWGRNTAAAGIAGGHINTAALMLDLFDAELPALVAPDAP